MDKNIDTIVNEFFDMSSDNNISTVELNKLTKGKIWLT